MTALREAWATGLDYNGSENKEGVLGLIRRTEDGKTFRWVKAGGTIAEGNVVMSPGLVTPAENADVDAAAAIGSNLLVATGDFAGDDYGPGDYVYIDAGAGAGQLREIDCVVDADTIRIKGTWAVALTAASDYIVFRPCVVTVMTKLIADVPMGIAQNAITSGNYGWVQTYGMGIANGDGSDQVLVPGQKCKISTSTDGAVEGIIPMATHSDAQIDAMGLAIQNALGYAVIDIGALDCDVALFITIQP